MRNRASAVLGMAQLVGAGVIGVIAFQTPAPGETFREAESATRQAGRQVQIAEQRLQQALASRGAEAIPCTSECDAESLRQLRDSLSGVADGLTAMAALLDDAPARELGKGLGEAADYLDKQVAAAEAAAQRLEETSELLRADSLRLAELLRAAPLDLDTVQQVHDALGKFAKGTEALEKVLEVPNLPAIRTGLQGLESSLSTGAQQVENLSSYTYPVVYFDGWRPRSYQQPFWPAGDKIAGGMTEAAAGVKAADKEMATLGTELPKVRTALESSRQILERSRDTLATVLKYRALIEPLVKSLPETAARLAEDLPKLSRQLSATLRETAKLKAVAASLRATQAQMEKSVAAWPQARQTLLTAAVGLKANRDRLDQALLRQSSGVSPEDQRAGLAALGQSLDRMADAQASQGAATERWLGLLRWGLLALAGVIGLQGVTQMWRSRRVPVT